MRISDWSSDVCSSDLAVGAELALLAPGAVHAPGLPVLVSQVTPERAEHAELEVRRLAIGEPEDLQIEPTLLAEQIDQLEQEDLGGRAEHAGAELHVLFVTRQFADFAREQALRQIGLAAQRPAEPDDIDRTEEHPSVHQ